MDVQKFWNSITFANNHTLRCATQKLQNFRKYHCWYSSFQHSLNSKVLFLLILILLCGDVEINWGQKTITQQGFSLCHWNLDRIPVHNFAKLFLLKAYVAIYKVLSETYLESSIPTNSDNLDIDGYNLVRSDHPSNTKCGGVCICLLRAFSAKNF